MIHNLSHRLALLCQNFFHCNGRLYGSIRILRRYLPSRAQPQDHPFTNIKRIIDTFFTHEVTGLPVRICCLGQAWDSTTDPEGWLHLQLPILHNKIENKLEIEIFASKLKIQERFNIPVLNYDNKKFFVVSDVDDTIIQSWVKHPWRMYKSVIMGNAYTRSSVAGMPELYQRCQQIGAGFIYVSKSPINLYEHLMHFLEIHRFPIGLLFLRQFGFSSIADAPFGKEVPFKLKRLRSLAFLLRHQKIVFFGDNGEQDAAIYQNITEELGLDSRIFIRNAYLPITTDNPTYVFDDPTTVDPVIQDFLQS